MGTDATSEMGDGAPAYPPEADPREVATAEMIRLRFDCSGSAWSERKSPAGTSCHGMPWPTGAPVLGDCQPYIEASAPGAPRGYKPVRTEEGAKWDPYEITPEFLFSLGGGRKYRVHLRHASRSIPHSYLLFDLTGHGAPRPLADEEPTTGERAPRAGSPSPAQPAAEMLALGADPIAAMLGGSVAGLDPSTRLAFALLLRDGERAREWADKTVAQSERLFGMMTGVMREAAKGGGGGEVATMLRAQVDSASKLAEQASRDASAATQRLHEKELAEARASSTNAPSPTTPLLINAGERLLGLAIETSIKTAGQEAVAKAIGTVAGAAGAAVGAVGAAG